MEEAERPVKEALRLIKERSQLALCRVEEFNEVLSAGYMEEQRMSVGIVTRRPCFVAPRTHNCSFSFIVTMKRD